MTLQSDEFWHEEYLLGVIPEELIADNSSMSPLPTFTLGIPSSRMASGGGSSSTRNRKKNGAKIGVEKKNPQNAAPTEKSKACPVKGLKPNGGKEHSCIRDFCRSVDGGGRMNNLKDTGFRSTDISIYDNQGTKDFRA